MGFLEIFHWDITKLGIFHCNITKLGIFHWCVTKFRNIKNILNQFLHTILFDVVDGIFLYPFDDNILHTLLLQEILTKKNK